MKIRKKVCSYSLKITEEPFEGAHYKFDMTARVSLRDENKNLIEKRKFGVIDLEVLYEAIHQGKDINLQDCLLHNFSVADYRKKYNIESSQVVEIKNLNAKDAFFEADRVVDFSNVVFTGDKVNFQGAHFGSGNTSFLKSSFQVKDVDFSYTSWSEGNNIFQYTEFSTGNLSFENAVFTNGNISFVNAKFNDGKAIFKNVDFGNGDVSMRFASFGNGAITFEKSIFRGKSTDFSKVDLGTGKVDFRRCDFGQSEVSFEEISFSDEKLQFRRAKFGDKPVSFKKADIPNTDILLDEVEFGDGRISFFDVTAKTISIKSSILSSYVDLRVNKCEVVDLSNCIVRDIIDFKKGVSNVAIDNLYFYGLRNLGKLFLNWEENDISKCVANQKKTSFQQKAEEFRLLKENFNSLGQYEDEDRAYILFKRNELKDSVHQASKVGGLKKLLAYINYAFQKIIFDLMGLYATSPIRVLFSIFIVNGLYSMMYVLFELTNHGQISCIDTTMSVWEKILDSFYFSAVTFLTIGYGECVPTGFFKIIAPLEGWSGVFMMSYFTVAFVRKILR